MLSVSMFVFETGAGGSPVLFLHSLGSDHTYWAPQHEALKDCLVLAPDLPGFGRSRLERTGLASAVDASARLIDERGGRAVVVGLSYGGYVAALLAAQHPDLVAGLAFSGVRGRFARPLPQLQAALFRVGVRRRDLARGETVADAALAMEKRNLVAASHELGSIDLDTTFPRIKAPTVVFAPEHDRFVRRAIPHIAGLLPNARVVEVPAAGHLWPDNQPGVLAAVVRDLLPTSA